MGITDKVTGRAKKAAGELADDKELKKEGGQEERKEDAREEAAEAEGEAAQKRREAGNLERST